MSEQERRGIFEAIPKVMAEIGAVTKSRRNTQQGYAFRGIDDMYNAVQPAMVKQGVFCCPEVLSREREERQGKSGGVLLYTTLTVRHRFYASDGSFVDVVTVGEAMDSGDKSTNKAMSAAMKYALIELFSIPTEEDNDTETHSHEVAPRAGNADQERAAQVARERDAREKAEKETKQRALIDDITKALAAARSSKAIDAEMPKLADCTRETKLILSPLFLSARKRVAEIDAKEGVVG